MSTDRFFFLKELFESCRLDLQRFLSSKFDAELSEDVVQDAFVNILNLDKIDEIQNPKAYLYQTAKNLALSRIRRESLHKSYTETLNEADIEELGPERHYFAQSELNALNNALDCLPEKYRKTFLMSRVQGKSYMEISQALGIPVSTVEKHMIKVLRFLRDNLEV